MATTYTYKETGNGGYLRIADNGTTVTFAIRAGDPSTFDNDLYWAYDVNGSGATTVRGSYNSRGEYKDLKSFTVTTSQTVWFSIQATGTSGLGGPTTHNRYIERASKPNAPSKPSTNVQSNTSIDVDINDGANNGASITARHIGIKKSGDDNYTWYTASSAGYKRFTGLSPDTVYYFRGRTVNSEGTSPESATSDAVRTFDHPDAPTTPTTSVQSNTSIDVDINDGANNGGSITEREIGIRASGVASYTWYDANSSGYKRFTGLSADTLYYFRGRTKNAYGTSPESATASATTYSKPDAPSKPVVTSIGDDRATVTFNDGPNNGGAITSRQIGWSTTGNMTGGTLVSSDGSTVVTGLPSSKTITFWARTTNAYGTSNYSVATTITTEGPPTAPAKPIISALTQTTMTVTFTDGANNGASITNRRIAVNTTNTVTGATIIASDGSTAVSGLSPGDPVYVWASTYNEHGWSAWSLVATATTIAGMFVRYNGVVTPAVPYVNVGGIWKLAEPYGKFYGTWYKPW